MARALYRSRQVWHALRPRVPPADLEHARAVLDASQLALFFAMEARDQRHALQVARRVRQETEDLDIIVAALLHDCAKGAVPVWLRILEVLAPALLRRCADPASDGWRGAAYRLDDHAAIGARLAEQAGCSEVVVRLIAGRTIAEDACKAVLLQRADDAS